MLFCSGDLDFDPMTLVYDHDPDILKLYLHIKMQFLGQGFQKLERYRQTDIHREKRHTQTDRPVNITTPQFLSGNNTGRL